MIPLQKTIPHSTQSFKISYKHYNKGASSANIHNTNTSYGIEFATDTDVHTVRRNMLNLQLKN